MEIKAVVITISDSAAFGQRQDKSGPAVASELERMNARVLAREIVSDDPEAIKSLLIAYSERQDVNLIVTTGGTGLGPRDNTPEATQAVAEKLVPGLAELMRLEGLKSTRFAALSRGVVALRNRKLIVNLPGSVKGATESLQAIAPLLPHAIEVITSETAGHGG